MRNLELYTLASHDFFESLSRLEKNSSFTDVLNRWLPADWTTIEFDVWVFAQPYLGALVSQGFKIHVAATRANAEALLDLVIPECVRRRLPFKFIADPRLLTLMNSKNANRASSGKFIVVYPPDLDSFRDTIERLHQLTGGHAGPYILSDERYKDSRVVFFRYGGFWPTARVEADGARTPCIVSPSGELVPDIRLPYFALPPWIEHPLGGSAEEDRSEEHLLNGRYKVEEAISFSNGGGVYKALDSFTGATVVIKEARPLSNFWAIAEAGGEYLDAPGVLRREYHALERLKDCPGVVSPIELFQEWEHLFLVEELVEGVILTRYRALDEFTAIVFDGDPRRIPRFAAKFRTLARQLLDIVTTAHRYGLLLSDISPNNFVIDLETLAVTMIDLEASIDLTAPQPGDAVVRHWTTPGFRHPGRLRGGDLRQEDDHYALAMVLFSLIIPVQTFFEMEPSAADVFLTDLETTLGLPFEVGQVIRLLQEGRAAEARAMLEGWKVDRPRGRRRAKGRAGHPWEIWTAEDRETIAARLRHLLPGMASFLLATYDARRDDRLWPADVKVFDTNPMSIACGAAGPLLLLADLERELPPQVRDWVLSRTFDDGAYADGLFWGLSGIAQALEEVGLGDKADEALAQVAASPDASVHADLCHGVAGVGWTALWFYLRRGDPRFLAQARRAGERLLATAEPREAGCCWRSSLDDKVHYGYAYGASGIALFLLELHQLTGEERYLATARRALEFELSAALDPAAPVLRWLNHEVAAVISEPYWEHGSAGIGSVFLRFARALGDDRYLDVARRAERYAFCKFAVVPGQFTGLSGIGDFLLDLYLVTEEEIYLNKAYAVAETVANYAVRRPEGIAFPGRLLLRLSNDFSTGSAGIGGFFHRLLELRPRRFLDLGGDVARRLDVAPAAMTAAAGPS